jgi:hypothetical protein
MPLGPLPSNYGRPWGEGPFWYFAKQETLTDNLCWLFERSQSLLSSEKSKLNLAEEETWESRNCTFFAWFCLSTRICCWILVRGKLENPWTTLFLLDFVQLDHQDLGMIYISFADEERGCCCHYLTIIVSYNWWCFFLPLSDDDGRRTGTLQPSGSKKAPKSLINWC